MASLMDTLVDRRANKNAGLMPFSPPTYAQVRCFFGSIVIVRAMYRLEMIEADRLPVTGPMVIAPNHDWVLDGLGAIRIKRSQGDQLALARMRQALDAGQAVAIFPQGAVCGDRVWHRGAARLALVTGAPLVPVRLVGTARALSRGRIGFPQLRIIFGEPIKVARAQEESVAATKLTERLRAAVESLA
jgi:1-acyl-sn-glycerol-3-phosphate acyltransferase